MSWFVPPVETLICNVEEAVKGMTVDYYGGIPKPYVDDQVLAAKAAAIVLAKSGTVGNTGTAGKSVRITIAGHGNEGHEPSKGWANDYVSVNVTQV